MQQSSKHFSTKNEDQVEHRGPRGCPMSQQDISRLKTQIATEFTWASRLESEWGTAPSLIHAVSRGK